MPIKVPNNLPAVDALTKENVFVMTDSRAMTQDIRPLHILLLNLMPTKIDTETQLTRLLGNTPLQIELELLQMSSHDSHNISEDHMIAFYKTFDAVKDNNYDGMIITGAPVEMMEFEEVDYWEELCEIMGWAEKHVHSSYLFHCEHCGFEDDIYVGSGFAAPVEFNETVEKVKNGTFGEKWKTMFESHPKTLVNIERTLYVCPSCGHYHSEPNMGLYVLKDGLTEEEIELAGQEPNDKEARYVYLYNMMWSLQYYRKIGNFIHRCPECGKRMHEGGYKDKPKCPKCGKQGNIERGRILWD